MDNFTEMTVEEYLFSEIDPYLLDDLSDRFPYWAKAADFVGQNIQRKLKTLSDKQKSWLLKIKRDLEAELYGK